MIAFIDLFIVLRGMAYTHFRWSETSGCECVEKFVVEWVHSIF